MAFLKRITKARKYESTKKTIEEREERSGKKRAGLLLLSSALPFFVFSYFRAFVILFSMLLWKTNPMSGVRP